MTIQQLVQRMDETFRPEVQEDYDNAGFLLGDPAKTVSGVITALDLTEAVAEEAIATGCNLIVTHHPFIFRGVKSITPSNTVGRLLLRLIATGTSVYAAHTNLDNLQNGVNGILAEQLGLTDCHILQAHDNDSTVGAGMIGTLPEAIPTDQFIATVKDRLQLPLIRVNGDAYETKKTIRRVAICGGAGSFLIEEAIHAHADIFLTGDLKYHDFQRGEQKIVLADIGHYESEQFCRTLLAERVKELADGSFTTQVTTACDRWEAWI